MSGWSLFLWALRFRSGGCSVRYSNKSDIEQILLLTNASCPCSNVPVMYAYSFSQSWEPGLTLWRKAALNPPLRFFTLDVRDFALRLLHVGLV